MKGTQKGFTLIELLVVIAIIGILASVVLVSLSSARNKGKDVRVISDVQQTRTALESGYTGSLYGDLYSTTASSAATAGTLTTNGPGNTNLTTLTADAVAQGSTLTYIIATNSTVGAATTPNATAYAIYGKLVSDPTHYFCIDSKGGTNPTEAAANITSITCL